jgi:hypothetical protein
MRECFATGWLSGEQREFAMGRGMLGQIVEDDQGGHVPPPD